MSACRRAYVMARGFPNAQASSREIGVAEVVIGPGDKPPLHIHKNEDE